MAYNDGLQKLRQTTLIQFKPNSQKITALQSFQLGLESKEKALKRSLVKAEITKGCSNKEFLKAIQIQICSMMHFAPTPAQKQQAHQQQTGGQQLMNPALQVLPIPPPQIQIPNTALQQNLMFPQQQQPTAQQAMSLMPPLPPISIPQLSNNVSMQQNHVAATFHEYYCGRDAEE